MTRIQTLGTDGIMYHSMANMNNDYSLGSELMINYEIKPGMRLVASGTLYNYWLKGEINGQNVDQQSTNFDGKLNFDTKLTNTTRMQLMVSTRANRFGPGEQGWDVFCQCFR